MSSATVDELADLIARSKSIYGKRGVLSFSSERQDAACRELNTGVLSLAAIGSIVDVSRYRVAKAIDGQPHPEARGKLNPEHLLELGYLLSFQRVSNREWIRNMISGGTSISTISDLTTISISTLRRSLA